MVSDVFEAIGLTGLAGPIGGVYAWWQSKQNKETITKNEAKLDRLDIDLALHKTHVAEKYVPIARFSELEKKIDRIYEWIIEHGE